MIPAHKSHEALAYEFDTFLDVKDELRLWWLGQSGFLIQWNDKRILLDPYLSDSLTTKYKETDKPHTRMSELVIRPELLKRITLVTSSHNHTDHLDAETLIPILKNNPNVKFYIPAANRAFVADRVKCNPNFPIGLNDNIYDAFDDITIHAIPAKHNTIERDEFGFCKCLGYIIKVGPYTIYHSGDTLFYDKMILLLRPYNIDIALLPINGDVPKRKVAGNLNCKEAAVLAKAINAKLVIPCHYDMFEFNTADASEFEALAESIGQEYKVLRGGEGIVM